jgi:hypothetical protein
MEKLEKNGMFYTPKSIDELLKYIEKFSGSERVVAMTIFGMTWNLCADLTSDKSE